jgi:hypothetical protein
VEEDQLKGVNIRKDEGEDVEGHMHKNAPAASHKLANDEGDDVEAHQNKNVHLEPSEVNLATDEDDDVEGHMHKNAVNQGMHKA